MSLIHAIAESLTNLIGLFNNKDKATAVILVMTALCLAGAVWIGIRHAQFRRALRSGAAAIDRAFKTAGLGPADRLNLVSADLEKTRVLAQAWQQYRASLREDARREGEFVNLIDPRAWFAVDHVDARGYEKWISTFANVSLCAGLLFTFIGLSAALMSVGNVDDAAHLREAINSILTVSSAKFLTSIFGILLFILWTIAGRIVLSGQHDATAALATKVQRLSTLVTPEVLLMDQLIAAREQTDRMRTLADDVAIAFEARLSEVVGRRLDAFPTHMGKSIRPVVEAIQGMGGSLSQGADNALARVAERLEQAAQTIQAAQGGIGASGTEFGNSIAMASATMTETVTRMVETIDSRLAGLEARISRVDEVLGKGAQSISGISDGLSSATSTALEEALRRISDEAARAAAQARDQSQAAMQPLLDSMREIAASIRDQAAKGSGELVDGGKSAAGLLAAAAKDISDRLAAATTDASGSLEKAAKGVAANLEAAVGQFQQLERSIAGHVGYLQRTGDTISSAGTTFGTAAAQLRQAAEPVQATLSTVEASARQASDVLKSTMQAQDGIKDASAKLADVSRNASQAFEQYRDRFASTDEVLARTFQNLVTGVQDLSREANKAVSDMQGQLAQAIGLLRTGIEEIDETVGNMQATAERLERAMGARVAGVRS
jgi:gas vesicle protein